MEFFRGPHRYRVLTPIGSRRDGVTPEAVFEALRRNATPFQNVRINESGQVTNIPGFGPVTHHVSNERLEITNITGKGHHLHPGVVHRRVVEIDGQIYVETEGYGYGPFPKENERSADLIWEIPDNAIKHKFDPSRVMRDRYGATGRDDPALQLPKGYAPYIFQPQSVPEDQLLKPRSDGDVFASTGAVSGAGHIWDRLKAGPRRQEWLDILGLTE